VSLARGLIGPLIVAVFALAAPARAGTPAVGSQAPDFTLPDQGGKQHALSDYRGQWVVLYFYPKDGTPGCTTEACEFRDNIFAFRQLGAVILGVSVDSDSSHKAFADKHHLPFTLLADPGMTATSTYGLVWGFAGMKFARRDTFIIDPQGRIVKHYESVKAAGHSQAVLADLKALVAAAKS
jgi:peroxiredoxin Q/BCP